jgi:hypothetical protein
MQLRVMIFALCLQSQATEGCRLFVGVASGGLPLGALTAMARLG